MTAADKIKALPLPEPFFPSWRRDGFLLDDGYNADQMRALIDAAAAIAAEHEAQQTDAARDVLAERRRQVEAEGWTPEHDDEHGDHSLAIAAACYALSDVRAALAVQTVHVQELWQWTGWSSSWFKPKDKRRNMIRAAALLLAEIERMDRAALRAHKETE